MKEVVVLWRIGGWSGGSATVRRRWHMKDLLLQIVNPYDSYGSIRIIWIMNPYESFIRICNPYVFKKG